MEDVGEDELVEALKLNSRKQRLTSSPFYNES